eukprot:scaffold25073_cov65-Phaeocystis_antarctica.AAC.3
MVRVAAAHRKRGPRGQSFVQHVSCNTERYQSSDLFSTFGNNQLVSQTHRSCASSHVSVTRATATAESCPKVLSALPQAG